MPLRKKDFSFLPDFLGGVGLVSLTDEVENKQMKTEWLDVTL